MVRCLLCLSVICLFALLAACGGGASSNDNSGSGSGGSSSSQAASISSISPASVQAGAVATTIQVTGSNFVSGSVVTFNASKLVTTYNSVTSLSAIIPASSLTGGETAEIAVMNPGEAASAPATFTVDSPGPVLTTVSPTSIAMGATGTLTLTGTGFESNSVVQLSGTNLATTFVSPSSLTATFTSGQVSQAGTTQVTVVNPTPGGGTSGSVNFQVTQLVPAVMSISPESIWGGAAPVTLTVSGSNFSPTATVTVNGGALTITAQSSTAITATLPSLPISNGTLLLQVTNPGVNAESSTLQQLVVVGTPTISQISPGAAALGGPNLTLSVSGTDFQPNSVINWNGTPLATTATYSNELTATIPASYFVGFSTNAITVSSPVAYPPSPGMVVSAPQNFSTYLSLSNNDLIYNPTDGYLYASVPGSTFGNLGNTVVAIDPLTGNLMRQIAVGSNPNQLAISSDGTQLFVGLDGAGAVRQVNLTTGQPGIQFSLGGTTGVYNPPFTAAALAALPGEPNSVAVLDISGDLRIFDSGVARPQTSAGSFNTYFDQNSGALSFGPTVSTLYAAVQPFAGVEAISIGATGVTGVQPVSTGTTNVPNGIQYDSGNLYLSNGTVVSSSTGQVLGTFSAGTNTAAVGPVVSDSALGLAFVANNGAGSGTSAVLAFNESSFLPTGSIPVSGVSGSFEHVVRWGSNGVAVSTPTQIYVYQSPVVKNLSTSPADIAVAVNAPSATTTGSTLTWTATVHNNGPNPAQGITLTSVLTGSPIIQTISPSQGSCAAGNAVTCDLGSLASGSTITLTITAIASVPGVITDTAMVSSVSDDPTPANNQATTTTAVTGNLYGAVPSISSISPPLVQAGSGGFTLTVMGGGFNSASTVEINGEAKLTTEVSSTQLTVNVDAASIANYGWATVTVSNPSPGGGVSNVVPLTIYDLVNVPANRVSFDPFTRKIYATLPSSATPLTGNSVVAIDPVSGTVGTPVHVGSEPDVMAETTDGNYLYIGLSGADSLGQFNLITQQLQATIPLNLNPAPYGMGGPISAYGLAAMPGSDTTLAVDLNNLGEPAILDISGNTGTFRTDIPIFYDGNNPVFGTSAALYTYDNYTSGAEFYRFTVNAQGLTEIDGSTMNGLGGATSVPFEVANGIVYGAAGGIVNPTTTPVTQIATLNTFGLEGEAVIPDPATAQAFLVLENLAGAASGSLYRYDTSLYVADAQLPLPQQPNGGEVGYDMLRWGQDGLALRSYGSFGGTATPQILLIRGPFVLPSELNANPVPAVTSASPASLAVNSGNNTLTITGSNFVPGAVVLWNGSVRTTTFVSSTQISVAIAAADVIAAGSETVTVQNPGSAASGPLTVPVQ